MLKAGLCSPVSIIPEKPFFVLHPSFLLNAVICLFRGQYDAVSHLAANHVYERGVCGHVGKGNPGSGDWRDR